MQMQNEFMSYHDNPEQNNQVLTDEVCRFEFSKVANNSKIYKNVILFPGTCKETPRA